MARFNWLAVAAVAFAGVAAACSDGTGTLSGPGNNGGSGSTAGNDPGTSADPGTSTDPGTTTTTTPGSDAGTAVPDPTLPAPPAAGPGSTTATAHAYFVANVYPKITACGACHNSGANGAPKMLGATADESYVGLDTRGLIVPNSLFLTKGVHFNGAAPALSSEALTAATAWLAMEVKDRAGTPAAASVFSKIGGCFTQTDYEAVRTAIDAVRTTRRTGENPNTCTGCNNTPCRDCHAQSEYGFLANNQVLQPSATYFSQWAMNEDFAKTFIGTNGTTLVPSPKLPAKAAAVATGKAYSHPMFTLPATVTTALTTFANNAITKYNAKTCGQ